MNMHLESLASEHVKIVNVHACRCKPYLTFRLHQEPIVLFQIAIGLYSLWVFAAGFLMRAP
jgi:hypothetical protein